IFNGDRTLLLNIIPALRAQPEPQTNLRNAVASFFSNSPLKLSSVSELLSLYPDFHDVYLWLRDNNGNKEATVRNFRTQIDKVLKRSGFAENAAQQTSPIDDYVDRNNPAPDDYYFRKIRL